MKPLACFLRLRASAWLSALLLAGLLATSGCLTTRSTVNNQTDSANLAALEKKLGPLPQRDGDPTTPRWEEVSREIDSFVAAHPTQPALTTPLRLRQALLLLANDQPTRARAVFESIDDAHLHTARDRALKANADHLLWWFANSASATWTASDQASAEAALRGLAATQDTLAADKEIRDYLAELRAWIGLAAAKQTTSPAKARARLEDALNGYARIFTAEELAALTSPAAVGASPLDSDTRRLLRARTVLNAAKKQNRDDGLQARPGNATFARLIAP